MVTIDSYSFGNMKVNGRTYRKDLILSKDKIIKTNWWRKEGHSLYPEDLELILNETPALLIVGTGASSRMTVPKGTSNALKDKGFDLKIAPTSQAVKYFNNTNDQQKVFGAFHLTC